jgi:hypothetical protein
MRINHLLIIAPLLIATSSHAETTELNSAGLLAAECRHAGQLGWEKNTASCGSTINAFVDGFTRGSERGLLTAFIKDTQNFSTLTSKENLQSRIDNLRKDAHCLPHGIQIKVIAQAFVTYVDIHPEVANSYYAEPLNDAIQTIVCNK